MPAIDTDLWNRPVDRHDLGSRLHPGGMRSLPKAAKRSEPDLEHHDGRTINGVADHPTTRSLIAHDH
jgi:hypothetical protein